AGGGWGGRGGGAGGRERGGWGMGFPPPPGGGGGAAPFGGGGGGVQVSRHSHARRGPSPQPSPRKSGARERIHRLRIRTTASTAADRPVPPARRARRSAPGARPKVRNCRTSAARTRRGGKSPARPPSDCACHTPR